MTPKDAEAARKDCNNGVCGLPVHTFYQIFGIEYDESTQLPKFDEYTLSSFTLHLCYAKKHPTGSITLK